KTVDFPVPQFNWTCRVLSSVQLEQARVARTQQDSPVCHFRDGKHKEVRHRGHRRQRQKSSRSRSDDAVMERGKNCFAVFSPAHCRYGSLRPLEISRGIFESSFMVAQQTCLQRYPEVVLGISSQAQNRTDRSRRGIRFLKKVKIQSVKPNQSFFSPNPEVTVWGLRDGIHRPAWKSPINPPALASVLRHRLLRLFRMQRTGGTRQAEACG